MKSSRVGSTATDPWCSGGAAVCDAAVCDAAGAAAAADAVASFTAANIAASVDESHTP